MDNALGIVIPNEVRNLVLSGTDCLVASLLAMTFINEWLNLGPNKRRLSTGLLDWRVSCCLCIKF
jgi:hypothetical protein